MKRNWIAWGITLGEGLLLLAFGVLLNEYWLMLPVRLRTAAAAGLGLAFAVLAYRFYKFQKASKPQPPQPQSLSDLPG